MLEPLNDDNLRDHLTALADGELDAQQAAAVWAYLADRPNTDALRWLADQQRLTLAARRTLGSPAPQDLRDRITALIGTDAPVVRPIGTTDHTTGPATSHWLRRTGYTLALAAAVAIGVTITHYASRPASHANPLPAELIVSVGRVHAACSRLPNHLHDARVSEIDPDLAQRMKAGINIAGHADAGAPDLGAPDLTPAGFRLVGAGPCPASKFKTLHLLYRSTKPPGLAAVSLFVQADTGQFPELRAGKVYRVSSPISPFPMLAWRTERVIYFLLADDDNTESSVLKVVHPTAGEPIIIVAG